MILAEATSWLVPPIVKSQPEVAFTMPAMMPTKTLEVFDYLKRCASEMRTAPHGEIGDAVGLPAQFLNQRLDFIRDEVCIPQGLPWLSALGVDAETRLPSAGWLPDGVAVSDDHLPRFWRSIVLQVFAVDWSEVKIENIRLTVPHFTGIEQPAGLMPTAGNDAGGADELVPPIAKSQPGVGFTIAAKLTPTTLRVFEYLKQCAAEKRTATYGEIASAVGIGKFPPAVVPCLNSIRDKICRSQDPELPWISVLGVSASTNFPGEGWIPKGTNTDGDSECDLWRKEVQKVYSHNWSEIKIENRS